MDKSRRVKRTHAGSTPTSSWLRDCWLAVFNLSTLTLLVYFSSPSPTSLSVTSLSLSPCAMIFFPRARHALGSVGLHLLLSMAPSASEETKGTTFAAAAAAAAADAADAE